MSKEWCVYDYKTLVTVAPQLGISVSHLILKLAEDDEDAIKACDEEVESQGGSNA